jgi:hypothetical protein
VHCSQVTCIGCHMITLISICGRYSSMHSIFAFCHICVRLSVSESLPVRSARDCTSPFGDNRDFLSQLPLFCLCFCSVSVSVLSLFLFCLHLLEHKAHSVLSTHCFTHNSRKSCLLADSGVIMNTKILRIFCTKLNSSSSKDLMSQMR